MILTPEQEDEFLDLVLPCDNEVEYQRALVQFAKKYERPAEMGLDEGDKWLRRRSVRRSDYKGTPTLERARQPMSWVDSRILGWALHLQNGSESKAGLSADYLAGLLRRTPEEVQTEITRCMNVKRGIQGFDL